MRFGKHPDQDHLNDYWNALERNAPPDEVRRLGEHLDPARKAALDQARSEYQRARPDPAFLARLETDLMNAFATTTAGAIPLPVTVPYPNGRSVPERSPWLPDLGLGRKRARWALASFAAALLILLAGIGGYFLYESQNDNPAVVVQPATPDAGPTGEPIELWRVQAGGPCDLTPVVVGQTVYAGCGDGILYALDVVDGSEIWRFAADGPIGTGLNAADGLVYVVDSGGTLYAVDGATGSEVWRFDSPVVFYPAVEDGLLAVGSTEGVLYGIDAQTGAERWRYQVTDSGETSVPAIANGVVFDGSTSGGLVAVDGETGELKWRADTPEGGSGTARVADGVVYISSFAPDGSSAHFAFDAESGDELWSQPLQYGTVSVRDGAGFGVNQNDQVSHVISFDATDGSERWRTAFTPLNRPIKVAGDVVYVPNDGEHSIFALDAETGEELWQFEVDGPLNASIAVTDGRLFAATMTGSIYAIGGTENVIPAPSGEMVSPVASPESTASEEPPGEVAFVEQILADPPFQAPNGVGTDREGRFYVADSDHNRVFVVDASGAVVASVGDESGPGQLAGPTKASTDSQGNVYVSNIEADRIQKFSADGTFLAEWPVVGDEPGKVFGVAVVGEVDEHDRVWVADWANHRVLVFDDQGERQLTFGKFGQNPGDLNLPVSVALDGNGNAFVSEEKSHRVSKFRTDGTFLMAFGEDRLKIPQDIAVDREGRVYVADGELGQVVVFGNDGQFLTAFGPDGSEEDTFVGPLGVGVNDAGMIVVTDVLAPAVYMFEWQTLADAADMTAEFLWASTGGPDPLAQIIDLAIHPGGTIWVLDTLNNRIQILDADGTFIENWGGPEESPFDFGGRPDVTLAFDSTGNLYIADAGNNRVTKFGPDRTFLMAIGEPGTGDGQFMAPAAVAVDADDNVYIGDAERFNIQKFDANGQYQQTFSFEFGAEPGQLNGPSFYSLDADGNLYIAEYLNDRVSKFAPDGAFIATFGRPGSGDGEFQAANGVSVDAAGNMYVAEEAGSRVQVLDPEGTFLMAFGAEGSGDGEFQGAASTELDGQGNIYVADVRNKRVQKFRLPESLVAAQQAESTPAAEVSEPVELVWTVEGGEGGFANAGHMAFDPEGRIWVADNGNSRFQIFDTDGNFIEAWGSQGSGEGQFQLRGADGDGWGDIAFAEDGSFYVLDSGNSRVQHFDALGNFVTSWGGFGSEPGQFASPIALAVAPDGSIWVADDIRQEYQQFSADGDFLASFSPPDGQQVGTLLAVTPQGTVIGGTFPANDVVEYDASGAHLRTIATGGEGDGQFRGQPTGMATDDSGAMLIAETPEGGRVQVFAADGSFLASWGEPGEFPWGIAIDDDGNVYVADYLANTLTKYRLLPPLGPEE